MEAAIYCRVSTHDQREEGTSLETQRTQCSAKARSLGWEVSVGHIILEDWTGSDLDRKGLLRLLEWARSGEIGGVVFHSLDRVYRPEHGQEWRIFEVLQQFADAQVEVRFVDSTVPTSGPLSGVVTFLDIWRAGRERDAIRERTMLGKAARLKEGRLPQGTGLGLYGYSWDKAAGRRQVLEGEAAVVRRIFQMAIEGKTVHGIAVALNEAGARITLCGQTIGSHRGSKGQAAIHQQDESTCFAIYGDTSWRLHSNFQTALGVLYNHLQLWAPTPVKSKR